MKKTLSLILTVFMMVGLFTALPADTFAVDADAQAVRTPEEFLAMDPNGSYYLSDDLLLDSTYAGTFTGSFDGRGHTVTVTYGAMFEVVEDANIGNFTVRGHINSEKAGYEYEKNDFAAAVAIVANGRSTFFDITSDLEFTTVSSNTRYAAIAATSAEGYDLTFENCINNGNISVVKYAAGIYGWTAQLGNITMRGCVNTGDITSEGYCGGLIARASAESFDIHNTFTSCVNKGNITSTKGGAGGLLGYSNNYARAERCVNFGNVTAGGGHAGGILANMANPGDYESTHRVEYNINYGNITATSASGHAGGIIGYVYGKANGHAEVNANVNLGIITGAGYCSQIIAYTNSNMTRITNNIGAGRVVGKDRNKALMVGLSSATITKYEISGNVFVENDGTVTYSYADNDKYAANRVELADRPAASITFMAAEKFENGEVAEIVNNALVSTLFEVRNGMTLLICRHEYAVIDGKCAACGAEIKLPAEDTTATDTETDAPVDTTLPEETTVVTEPTESKSCGGITLLPSLIAVVCAAAVVLIKKKQ